MPEPAEFAFPVLGFTRDLDVWGFADLEALTTCGPRTLKNDMQIGMELVDAEGRRWSVRSVRRVGRTGSLIGALLSGPVFRIAHDLEAATTVSLEDAQERVCAAMRAFPDYWCEDDERDTVLPARLAEVRATRKFADIHAVLGLDNFRGY